MEPQAAVGDLPGSASPLAQLAAALGPNLNDSEEQALWGRPEAPHGAGEALQNEPEALEAAGSGGTVADVFPISQAARMFADACEGLHVQAHLQLLQSLNELANEAYAPAMRGTCLGKGATWVDAAHGTPARRTHARIFRCEVALCCP